MAFACARMPYAALEPDPSSCPSTTTATALSPRLRPPDFSGLGIRNLLDGNGECSGVDGRAAGSGDGEGVGSGGGVEGLGTAGPATAAGTSAGDDGDKAGKQADGEKERLSANEVARPCGGAPNSATADGEESE